ncbi:MAG: hypothetical protein MJ053_03395 [Elusimicrobiaceae bacterium]|nr:hypothetical protein [Elusimicrobiaceae bacterium]
MEISNDMSWLLFLFCFIGFFIWVFTLLKKQLGRVFPHTYKTYRPTLPQAVNVWRRRSGGFRSRMWFGLRVRGSIKVELLPHGILVSIWGKALWLPFDTYKFTASSFCGLSILSVDNIPVQPIPLFFGFNFLSPTTTLTLWLPEKACEEILRMQKAVLKQN